MVPYSLLCPGRYDGSIFTNLKHTSTQRQCLNEFRCKFVKSLLHVCVCVSELLGFCRITVVEKD